MKLYHGSGVKCSDRLVLGGGGDLVGGIGGLSGLGYHVGALGFTAKLYIGLANDQTNLSEM